MIKRPKVLIVEDNLMHQKVIVHILNKYFTKDVITTANPKEAFPILRTNKPDFLIMDIEMPLMNGVEMLELIRNMEGLEDLKVIAYSAKLEKEIIRETVKYSVLDYIYKGSDQKVIVARLNKHFKDFQSSNSNNE